MSSKQISTCKIIVVKMENNKFAKYNSEILVYIHNNFSHANIKSFDEDTNNMTIELSKPLIIVDNKKSIMLKISNEYIICFIQ
jgi:hypothetical protein